jgi:hypothetical protein
MLFLNAHRLRRRYKAPPIFLLRTIIGKLGRNALRPLSRDALPQI